VSLISSHHTKNFRSSALRVGAFSSPFLSLAFFLATLLPVSASAANESKTTALALEDARWFQVELILFAQQKGEPLEAEQWPDLEGITLPDTLLELYLPTDELPAEALAGSETPANPDEPVDPAPLNDGDAEPPADPSSALPDAYQILSDDNLQLNDIVKKLQRSSRFKPLLHIAWQQPTYDRQHAQPIFFMEGMADPLPSVPSEDQLTDETLPESIIPESMGESPLPPLLEYATEADTKIGPPNPQFVGTVTLSVERYLHLAADLIYRQPVTQNTAVLIPDLELWYDRPYPTLHEPQGPAYRLESWQAMRGFRLKESRRMRSKVIHYLDNPFMGLVVVITPVELPEPEEEIQQTSPQNILLSAPKKR